MSDGSTGGDFPDLRIVATFCEPEIAIGSGSDAVIVTIAVGK